MPIQTTCKLEANKPDIVLFCKEMQEIYIIELSCPFDSNIAVKYAEKLRKYEPLATEMKRLYKRWNVKICPLIFGELGGIRKDTINIIKVLPNCQTDAKYLLSTMPKVVLLGTLRTA
jgi:hypothetical protein